MDQQFDFIKQRVLEILKNQGFDKLSEDDQKAYLTQFSAEAERRLGLAVLPQLSETAVIELEKMTNQDISPDQWFEFWNNNVTDFTGLVDKTLKDFAVEIEAAFKM